MSHQTYWTAAELVTADFPDPRWAVPGLLAEGVNLLAGAPKVGKSWAALNIAVAVASGGRALGKIDVTSGDVLYLALEDTPRRLAERLRKVLGPDPAPRGLAFATASPSLPDGGAAKIGDWLTEHPCARLVIVDVFARIRGRSSDNASAYDLDYAAMSALKQIADRHRIALLVVHHTRKAASEDFLHEVSGTNGLAGAADAVLVLKRMRGSADAELHVTGRDVDEHSYALSFDADLGAWRMLAGPAGDYALGDTRQRILRHLRSVGAATPKEITEALGLNHNTAKVNCKRMTDDGQIDTDGNGHYFPVQPVTPVTDVIHDHDDSHTGYRGYTPDRVAPTASRSQGSEDSVSPDLRTLAEPSRDAENTQRSAEDASNGVTQLCGHPSSVINTENRQCALCIVASYNGATT